MPNIVIILCDDLGYGDIDSPAQNLPKIHRIAEEGACSSSYGAGVVVIEKNYVSRVIQSLKQVGYVAVVPTTIDGYNVSVSLTSKDQVDTGRVESAMCAR